MKELFQTLQERRRPEDVAEMIREKFGHTFSRKELKILEKAAALSLKRSFNKFTSMMEGFHRPRPPERQVSKALELFKRTEKWTAQECADPKLIESFIRELGSIIKKEFGSSDFKRDRLNSEQRELAGLDISRRRYNKLFRFLRQFEIKLKTYLREQDKYEFTRIGKSRLTIFISQEDFSSDANSACFIAYYSARCNLRSVFTNTSQDRPYDEIADMLFHRLLLQPTQTNWWAVAHAHTDGSVIQHLTDEQRGRLLGLWLSKLSGISGLLQEVWANNKFDRATMIVRRGNDSTTWNNTASAWNRARQAWIALLHGMGMEEELHSLCLGKVLRLMAADVAAWHRASGKELDPDTKVWADLPLPWEVLSGNTTCTKKQVEDVCIKYGVNPIKNGWIAPAPKNQVAKFKPTPELVHGVTVADPQLALILRKAGWFSGQWNKSLPESKDNFVVIRDVHGFAVSANQIGRIDDPKKN